MKSFISIINIFVQRSLVLFFAVFISVVMPAPAVLAQTGDGSAGPDGTGGSIPQESPVVEEPKVSTPVEPQVPAPALSTGAIEPVQPISAEPAAPRPEPVGPEPVSPANNIPTESVPASVSDVSAEAALSDEPQTSAPTSNNLNVSLILGVTLGAIFGGLGVYRIRKQSNKNEHTNERCQQIAETLTQKKAAIAEMKGKFSLQEAAIKELKKKLSEVKSKVQSAAKEKMKDSIVALDTSGATKKVVDAIDEVRDTYESILKKIDQAQKILNVFRSQINQLTSEISALESTYNACVLATTGKEISLAPGKGKEIPLPSTSKGKFLKFSSHLIPMILRGEENSTVRFFDDKDLRRGDELLLINKSTDEQFGEAIITHLYEKKFIDLTGEDYAKNEKHESEERKREAYQGFYEGKIKPDTIAKIITFELKKPKEEEQAKKR